MSGTLPDFKLPQHGRDHLPGHADPIPLEGLRYDFDNEGDWFFAAANDATGSPNGYSWQFDTGGSGMPFAITGDGGLVVVTEGAATLRADSGWTLNTTGSDQSFNTAGGTFEVDTLGSGSDGDIILNAYGASAGLLTDQLSFTLYNALNLARTQVGTGGTIKESLGTGAVWKVVDHTDASVIEVRDDGTVHIRTGGTVVADL